MAIWRYENTVLILQELTVEGRHARKQEIMAR